MTKPFYLLNVARGKIVRVEALIKAIENGKVLGALNLKKPVSKTFKEKFQLLFKNYWLLIKCFFRRMSLGGRMRVIIS